MSKIKELFKKYYEQISYIFFGGCTTLVYLVAYWVATRMFGADSMVGTVISWIVSVTFAYITNKLWVFESKTDTVKALLREAVSFYTCRLLTLGIDLGFTFSFVNCLHFPDMIIKVLANVVVILANYILSKLLIFKGKTDTVSE